MASVEPLLTGGGPVSERVKSIEEAAKKDSNASNLDDFDFLQGGLHKIDEALTVTKGFEWIDEAIAFFFVGSATLFLVYTMGKWLVRLIQGAYHGYNPSAVALAKFSGDLITAVALAAIVLMWSTICYRSQRVHTFWQGKYTKMVTKTLMPGGFAPRPTALSLGTLMFVTSTLIKEDLKSGSQLTHSVISGYEGCRATEMEPVDANEVWLSRLRRHGPANMGFTCFDVNQTDFFGWAFTTGTITAEDYDDEQVLVSPQFHQPVQSTGYLSGVKNFIPRMMAQDVHHNFTQDMVCKYQCIKWQSVGVKSLLGSVSVLLVGCATITKFTDLLSKSFGGRRIGGEFVTEDTTAEEMQRIMAASARVSCFPRSRAVCFLILIFAFIIPMLMIAPKVCLDGYYSVDYWVTGIFLSSLTIALILRRWNPFLNVPMIYTKKLWEEGEDVFVKIDPPHDTEYTRIDLYHWFHLSTLQRNNHLFKYARKVSPDDIDTEIEKQKEMRKTCLTVTIAEDEDQEAKKPLVDRVYVLQPPADNVSNSFLSSEGVGIYQHATDKNRKMEFEESSRKWKLTYDNKEYACEKAVINIGDVPPAVGTWEDAGGSRITVQIKPAGSKPKTAKKDLDTCGGKSLSIPAVESSNVPPWFREKEGTVYYDPALVETRNTWQIKQDEARLLAKEAFKPEEPTFIVKAKEAPLLVMCLNTFESVDWIEGNADDVEPRDEKEDVAPSESSFVVRKVRTTIDKGTVGVVVTKKSNDEAVINWHYGEKRFFPPLKGKKPDETIRGRIKATCKLTNLLEVSSQWAMFRSKCESGGVPVQLAPFKEPSSNMRQPHTS